MPLYEYRCEACGQLQEHLVRAGESPACADCGSPRLAKLLSAPVAHVSGSSKSGPSGWGPSGSGPSGSGPSAGEWGGCGRPGCGPAGCAGM